MRAFLDGVEKLFGSVGDQVLMIGALDDNVDGLVQASELRGRMGAMLKARFAELDRDKNGGLDNGELLAMGGRRAMREQVEVPDL